jgi:putative sporulation protein YtaF
VDGFAAAVAMACSGIRIPARSAVVLSLTGTVFLGVSAFFADSIGSFFPPLLCKLISAALLIALGLYNIFKEKLRKRYEPQIAETNPSIIFLDELKSDTDHNKIISVREAAVLSVVLSADSLATGAASAKITEGFLPPTLLITFIAGFSLIVCGNRLGRSEIFCKLDLDFEKLAGVILILLAVVNIF